jgi:hypothetical protein
MGLSAVPDYEDFGDHAGVLDALDAAVDALTRLDVTALSHEQLLDVLERTETAARRLPVSGHRVINRLKAEATAAAPTPVAPSPPTAPRPTTPPWTGVPADKPTSTTSPWPADRTTASSTPTAGKPDNSPTAAPNGSDHPTSPTTNHQRLPPPRTHAHRPRRRGPGVSRLAEDSAEQARGGAPEYLRPAPVTVVGGGGVVADGQRGPVPRYLSPGHWH